MGPIRIPVLTDSDKKRFWDKVGKTELCWEWLASTISSKRKYGRFGINGKLYIATRVSYFLQYHIDPGDFLVCHTCDNTLCVRPDHLWLGTNEDNVADCVQKERHTRGSKQNKSKLIEIDIPEILKQYKNGLSTLALAAKFSVSRRTITSVLNRDYWKHVNDEKLSLARIGSKNHASKLTEDTIKDIRLRFSNGDSQTLLAKQYGVGCSTISCICLRKTWKHVL